MASDLSNVPPSSLRHQTEHYQSTPPSGAETSSRPPAHHLHHHDHNNPHFYEGFEPGNQGAHHEHEEDHDHYTNSSGAPTRVGTTRTKGYAAVDDQMPLEAPTTPWAEEGGNSFKGHHRPTHSRASSMGGSSADETDDFDWDTSDDDGEDDKVVDSHGNTKIRAKRGRKVYLFCMRLARPVRVFLLGAFLTVLCLVPLFVVLFGYDSSNKARPHVESWSIWIAIIFASSAGTFIILDWFPPLILKLAVAVYGRSTESFKTYLEVAITTLIYVKLVLCIAWAWISLGGILAAIWKGSTGPRPDYWTWVLKVIKALFATSVILAAEKFALHIIGVNFHKEAIKDRLEENQKALKYLDKLYESKYLNDSGGRNTKNTSGNWGARFGLSGSRPVSPGPNAIGGGKAAKAGNAGQFPFDDQHSNADPVALAAQAESAQHSRHKGGLFHHRQQSASQERLANAKAERKANFASQLQDALATATMKDSKLFRQGGYGSQQSARKLAKKLFHNLGRNRKTLVAEDFIPYFKSEEEAREAFAIFDKDNNGDIEKSEMREAVQRIYRERRALATSLKDMNSALQKLDMVLMFLGLIIVIFIWLLIFSPEEAVANLVPMSTLIVGFSFVFGNSAKNIFESMIFIFATHPYDVGDLVCIDDTWMFVKEFGLISTTFNTTVNTIVVAPNALLASSKYIHNARRSGNQWEVTMIQMGFDTALQTIDEFRRRLRAWVKENDREWGGGLEVNYNTITNQNAVEMVIAMEHKGNWQTVTWGERWSRRTKLMRQSKLIAEQLGIQYSLPPQPVTYNPKSGPGPRGTNVGANRPGAGNFGASGQSTSGGANTGMGGLPPLAGGVGTGFGMNVDSSNKTS
ncbi:unnamed protein product [Sympodiomycopsis kandeliae]